METKRGSVVLVVMDGWGLREETSCNAIALARTPSYDSLCQSFPFSRLTTSGLDVGLPEGTMGNSEVGHLNLGAGRVVWQQVMQINRAIDDGSFVQNPALREAMETAATRGLPLHLFGLVSDALVHSSEKHYLALIDMAEACGVKPERVFFHAFTDGRDSAPHSAAAVVGRLESYLAKHGGRIATVIGRYYAMDRDKRWPRTQLAYSAMVLGKGEHYARSGLEAVEEAYGRAAGQLEGSPFPAETDEFIRPTVIVDEAGPIGRIGDGAVLISFNHRSDRPRQIIRTLIEQDFAERTLEDPHGSFVPVSQPSIHLVTMTDYRAGFDCPVAFGQSEISRTLAEIVSLAGLRQLHVAETEKYPHVTFFFNGGREKAFQGEDRFMAPSPQVATYDLQPEMSAAEVTEKVLSAIRARKYGFIIVNYANGDMVGHTGKLEAAVRAVETVDRAIGQISDAVLECNGQALITADHGNCEQMWDAATNGPHTAHTTNPVPCILVSGRLRKARLSDGRLADVAPTLLSLLELAPPAEMDGKDLIEE